VLNKLSYSVTFPTTGRTLAGEFEFKPGFGLINGANEQGKSVIIEVVSGCSNSNCYSITTSARASTPGGIVRPRALAVFSGIVWF
jgi:predicted ATPase